jgi:L-cysteine:1D-myo-inositol 2-amino-2-deoxy-alpha-D-glucopyranoside ligase
MKFYNTLSQQLEDFTPRGQEVTLYVCGITPYDTTHLGHAFTYCSADVLVRYLELRELTVRYVQNITDIDDDILLKAKETGEDWRALGDRWIMHFIHDMQTLNVRPPDFFPRATSVIPDIITAVQALIDAGSAYFINGSVYYRVATWPEFGKLSHLPVEEMLPVANERGNRPNDPNKKHPLDFVLWQAQAPGEPAWDSPWGPGRPGWHIECSTMSTRLLGDMIDFHGGGADLCFPHHECEIAQVEPVTGKRPFVRYWLHTAMVRYQGEKMSKSLGNLVMVRDLLQDYPADAIRLLLANHHYRDSWEYEDKELDQAAERATRLAKAVGAPSGAGSRLEAEGAWAGFLTAMDNDLDTPKAVILLDQLARDILAAAAVGRDVREAQSTLRKLGRVFGLHLDGHDLDPRPREGWDAHLKAL